MSYSEWASERIAELEKINAEQVAHIMELEKALAEMMTHLQAALALIEAEMARRN